MPSSDREKDVVTSAVCQDCGASIPNVAVYKDAHEQSCPRAARCPRCLSEDKDVREYPCDRFSVHRWHMPLPPEAA